MQSREHPTPGAVPTEAPTGSDRHPTDRFRHLPPAVPVAATVAVVGAAPPVPMGPEGAVGGDDVD